MVQKLSRAHLSVVSDDRRERAREKKRVAILRAADSLISEEGMGAVTMQRVAERLDCAVGTLYLYFDSKAALVTALQGEAIVTLRASYAVTVEHADRYLDEGGLDDATTCCFGVLCVSEFWIAASIVFADEFAMQRSLLGEPVAHRSLDELTAMRPLIDHLLTDPVAAVRGCAEGGVLTADASVDGRALTWIAALNGVLLVDGLAPLDQQRFRGHHLARGLTRDLLVGWGAPARDVDVAAADIERLVASVPMAPPVPEHR